ncbi:MAG: hypothetical protein FWD16_06555, partial [Clostridia bacterium]|nr:hypothetical protein [Clostridia bacterium]
DGLKPGTTYKFWVRVAAKDAEYAPGENFGPLEVETDIDLLPTESPTDVPTPTGTNTTGTPDTPTPTGTNTTGTPDTPTPTGNTDTPDSPTPTEDKPTKLGDANCDGFVNIDDILFVRDEIFGANKITAIGRLNLLMGPDDRCSIDHILAIRDVIFGGEFKI